MVTKKIQTAKGHCVSATVYEAEVHTVLIIASATGVKQAFYKKFVEFISDNGTTVITFDYYGIGASLTEPIQTVSVTAAEWGSNDLEAVIQWTKLYYSKATITVLGHSIGGQLIGLAPSSTSLQRIVLVAAQSGYWKFWPGLRKLQMWIYWHVMFPTITHIVGYMPSKKFSGIENLPKQVALQWSKCCRRRNYLFDDLSPQQLYFHKVKVPIVAIIIEKDKFAPKLAVDWLTEKYHSQVFKTLHLRPKEFGVQQIGHFGVFKEKFRPTIWEVLRNELAL